MPIRRVASSLALGVFGVGISNLRKLH